MLNAWRVPQKIAHVLQEGRVYVLDTGQKVHFEHLKPHNGGPTKLVAAPVDSGDIAVLMGPEPERSIGELMSEATDA